MQGRKPSSKTAKLKQPSSHGLIGLVKQRNKLIAVLFVVLFASVGSYLLFFGKAATAPSQLGVYTGPADIVGHDAFSQWLGSPVSYSVQFVDFRNGWDIDFTPNWLLDPLSTNCTEYDTGLPNHCEKASCPTISAGPVYTPS